MPGVNTGFIPDEAAEQMAATGQPVPGMVVEDAVVPGTAPGGAPVAAPIPEQAIPRAAVAPPPAPAPAAVQPPPQPSPTLNPTELVEQPEQTGPPPEVAGLQPVAAEHQAQTAETGPYVDVRGVRFRLRRKVPGMLIMRLAKAQSDLSRPQMQVKTEDEKLQAEQSNAQASVMAAAYDAMVKLVVPEEQTAFVDHCSDAEPEIEMQELLSVVLATMMAAVTGNPTQSASA